MRSGPGQRKDEDGFRLVVDQKPVRRDVALSVSDVVSGKRVVMVLFRHRLARLENADGLREKLHVATTLFRALVIALEHICPFDVERRPFGTHRFNSAKAKSRGIPRLVGSLPISSVSRMASSVSGL